MASDKENFSLSGPSFLTAVDWNNSNHRRSIAASLVQGVYVLECDRLQNRAGGPSALAPPWWESFNFKLHQVLIDDKDQSIFAAVYEFNFPYPPPTYVGQRPPHYVIAFRGKIQKSDATVVGDLKTSLNFLVTNLQDSRSFQIGLEASRSLISRAGPGGPGNVWLAGHSIGASLTLVIGRNMVKSVSAHLETYLFNPPFASAPIERIKNEKVKMGLRMANSVLTAGLAVAAKNVGSHKPDQPRGPEVFEVLSSWVPYLFVSSSDMICSEYVGYFEHREKMEAIGAGKIGRLATKHSIGSIVSSSRAKKDVEAVHLLPSAYLTTNTGELRNFKEAHGIHQWWKPDLELKYKLYRYV